MSHIALVTGAGGQLGRELQGTTPADWTVVALDRATLDIADTGSLRAALDRVRPAAVINAAAYTAVDKAETEAELAARSNAEGPSVLAGACAELGIRLVHISTDFVFDGAASQPYRPADATGPLGEYGRSKLAGERGTQAANPAALILRTGWVYSRFGNNFVKTMLRLMAERDQLSVVVDQVGTPTWARGLALTAWAGLLHEDAHGIYHWSDAGVCSWYDFAVAIQEEALALGLLQREIVISPIPASDYPTPAARPSYSVLDKSSTCRDLDVTLAHWRAQLRAMLADLKENSDG
jgi:dTDP-4-dehydrorhamnose reductase